MITDGKFIYKSIQKKEAGEFINTSGQKISYPARYEVKFDEIDENDVANERKTNISLDQTELIEKFRRIKKYTEVKLRFEIGFNSRGITAKLIDVGSAQESKSAQ